MDSNGQLLEGAVLKYVTKSFTEQDWIELGIETGTLDLIQGNERLLRALSWGDPDYAKQAVAVTKKILKTMGDDDLPDLDQVKAALPNFKAWLKEHDVAMYWKLFGPAPVARQGDGVNEGPVSTTSSASTRTAVTGSVAPAPATLKPTVAKAAAAANPQKKQAAAQKGETMADADNEIFIVHGHDHSLRNEVYIFLQKVTGKNPVVLDFQASGGRTLIEKLEAKSAKSSVAVVLLTPDDVGAAKSSSTDLQPRARQNVVFEMGFFVGALSRSKVITINDGVEAPSDIAGLVYIPHSAPNWYEKLRHELIDAGVKLIA